MCETIGIKPDTCNSTVQKIGSICLLVLVAISIIYAYCKLSSTLKNKFNDAYLTHGPRLKYFTIGMECTLIAYTCLLIVPLFQMNVTAGVIQAIV